MYFPYFDSGRQPSVENDIRWKTTFGGRQPLVEDNLLWKTTFSGRWSLLEDDLWWKTTCGGRQPSVEDNLLPSKTVFHQSLSSIKDCLWLKVVGLPLKVGHYRRLYSIKWSPCAKFHTCSLLPYITSGFLGSVVSILCGISKFLNNQTIR